MIMIIHITITITIITISIIVIIIIVTIIIRRWAMAPPGGGPAPMARGAAAGAARPGSLNQLYSCMV